MLIKNGILNFPVTQSVGRITPPFRQLYQETVSELQMELKAALVDLGHKSAFDLLLKEAWNPEQAAMGNSTLSTDFILSLLQKLWHREQRDREVPA